MPVGLVHGAVISNGGPVLGVVSQSGPNSGPTVTAITYGCNSISLPTDCTAASPNLVNATAGNIGAHFATETGNLTIVFNAGGVPLITVGAEFWLYLSQNGVSGGALTAGDIKYAGPFLGTTLTTALKGYSTGYGGVVQTNGTYYIGTTAVSTVAYQIVEGPLPIAIPAGYTFIKIYDGTAVAAYQYLVISPGIRLSPTSGPANTPVTVLGGGFTPNTLIDLNYSYTLTSYTSATTSSKTGAWETGVSTTANGYFSHIYPALDTKQSVNTLSTATGLNDKITITAVKHTVHHTIIANNPAIDATPAVFTEMSRVFTQVISWDQRGILLVNDTATSYYGNDSGFAPIISVTASTGAGPKSNQPIWVYATGTLWIAGKFWNWGGAVTFYVSNSTSAAPASSTFNLLGSTTAGSTSKQEGTFGLNLTMPTNLVEGLHLVKVMSGGVYYTFQIYMNPTLVLTPYQGTCSNPSTTVRVTAYGFPAKIAVFIYWYEISYGDETYYNLVNSTTGKNGQLNVSTTFVVPETYGGDHLVSAFNGGCLVSTEEDFIAASFSSDNYIGYYDDCGVATTTFTVLPSLVVVPGSFNSTYGGNVVALGEGLTPYTYYVVNIDNQYSGFTNVYVAGSSDGDPGVPGIVLAAMDGTLNLTFIGAGFSPGLHSISLSSDTEWGYNNNLGSYYPDIFALFTVTPIGSWDYTMLNSISTSISGFSSSISTLSTNVQGWINGAVTSINGETDSKISTLSTTITGAITSAVTSINSNTNSQISTLSTTITGAITSAVTSINSHTDSAVTTLSTSITSAMTSINSHVDSAVSGIASSGAATNIQNAVNTEQTYVLVVAVLAVIILVLVLAVLIRKLS